MTKWPKTRAQRFTPVKNASGVQIPAYAVMKVTGVEAATGAITVTQPDAADLTDVIVNGPSDIPIGKYGKGTMHYPAYALYDVADVPAAGEDYGTQAGQWTLKEGNDGFRIVGNAANGRVMVFFLTVNPYDVQLFTSYRAGVDSAFPNTHYNDGRMGHDLAAAWNRYAFVKLIEPVTCKTGKIAACAPCPDNIFNVVFQTYDPIHAGNQTYNFLIRGHYILEDFDVTAVTWNNQPINVVDAGVPTSPGASIINNAGTYDIRVGTPSSMPGAGTAGYSFTSHGLSNGAVVYGMRFSTTFWVFPILNSCEGQLRLPGFSQMMIGF